MANRRLRLVEIDFRFLTQIPGGGHQNQITVQASLLRSKLSLSFSIGGPAESHEMLPAALIDAIKAGIEYAEKHVRVQDLMEVDPEPECEEERVQR